MMGDFATLTILTLATWWLTYQFVLGLPLEWLRGRLGVEYIYENDEAEWPTDRVENTAIGMLLNCHSCTAILAAGVVLCLWWFGPKVIVLAMAIMGGCGVVGRWWTSQRPRKEWWL